MRPARRGVRHAGVVMGPCAAAGVVSCAAAGTECSRLPPPPPQLLFTEEVKRCVLTFDQQFHYAVFYAYLKLREQEIRNLMWISECIAQGQRNRTQDGIVLVL